MKTKNIILSLFIIAISILASASNTLAQSQTTINKIYMAKVYSSDKKPIKGILYSVDDSSITLCIDTTFSKKDPLNDSLKMITVSYETIKQIKLIRKGAIEKGILIGALAGGLPGLMLGAAADFGAQMAELTLYVTTFGTVEPEPSPAFTGVFALTGTAIGGLMGLAAGSSIKNFTINNSFKNYVKAKEKLMMYSIIKYNLYSLNEVQ